MNISSLPCYQSCHPKRDSSNHCHPIDIAQALSLLCLLQEGSVSVVELLKLARSTVVGLTPQAATVHCDAVWSFCLKVLAFRQELPAGIRVVRSIEDAAIHLVLALTLKLTETTFKPLFLRLIDWAAQPPASGPSRSSVFYVLVVCLPCMLCSWTIQMWCLKSLGAFKGTRKVSAANVLFADGGWHVQERPVQTARSFCSRWPMRWRTSCGACLRPTTSPWRTSWWATSVASGPPPPASGSGALVELCPSMRAQTRHSSASR